MSEPGSAWFRQPVSENRIRAVYGGFGVATGVLLTVAAFDGGTLRDGVAVSVAVALAGMAFGRLVARQVDRPTRFYPTWFYFWVEVFDAALLSTAALVG